jgi:NADPH2:quinone reductase
MRAVCVREFGPVDSHPVTEVSCEAPGPDEVLIAVRAIGLNYPDLLMLQGRYQVRPPLPFIPGRDAAGLVEAVGRAVTQFAPGDRVMCQVPKGAFAEKVSAPVERCFPIPSGANFTEAAAMITPYNTAYVAVAGRSRLNPADVALVTGASGSVGIALIELAKARGARVIACVSSPGKEEYVRAHGADAVVHTQGDNLRDALRERVAAVNHGKPVDVVFETIGGQVFSAALRTLGFDGRMVVIGFSSAQIPEVRCNYLLYKNLSVVGAPLDIHFKEQPAFMQAGVRHLRELFEKKQIRPLVGRVMPFEDFPAAMRLMSDRTVLGRIILEVAAA